MEVKYSSKFYRAYKKLPIAIKLKAEKQERIFRRDPFDIRLKTHKLSGKLNDFWSFSVDYSFRIVFQFADDNLVYFHDIGDHDVYK